jgi:hypothetical protein
MFEKQCCSLIANDVIRNEQLKILAWSLNKERRCCCVISYENSGKTLAGSKTSVWLLFGCVDFENVTIFVSISLRLYISKIGAGKIF